jgi:hypothetical protein
MLIRKTLIITGCALNIVWGTMHLVNTAPVVRKFGALSVENGHVITMEWINEGATLLFIGILVLLVTIFSKENNRSLKIVYFVSGMMMFALAIISFFTGFNIDFLPYKLCVPFFIASGTLFLQGAFQKR